MLLFRWDAVKTAADDRADKAQYQSGGQKFMPGRPAAAFHKQLLDELPGGILARKMADDVRTVVELGCKDALLDIKRLTKIVQLEHDAFINTVKAAWNAAVDGLSGHEGKAALCQGVYSPDRPDVQLF